MSIFSQLPSMAHPSVHGTKSNFGVDPFYNIGNYGEIVLDVLGISVLYIYNRNDYFEWILWSVPKKPTGDKSVTLVY